VGAISCQANYSIGLAVIGYKIEVIHTMREFWAAIKSSSSAKYHVIITDYDGLGTAENAGDFPKHHCRYYIVDGFGTHQSFNAKKRQLDLKHILTPYPFDLINSPINMLADQLPRDQWKQRLKQGVIWAKSYEYITPAIKDHLQSIIDLAPLHSTFGTKKTRAPLPFVTHDVLSRKDFFQLLTESRFVIGIGKPLDGPTALEVLAHGCVLINPTFSPPLRLQSKPTDRRYTSQHPFVEQYVPRPHAYSIDITNHTLLRSTVQEILSQPPPGPYIHPFHTAAVYVENLRHIFEVKRLECREIEGTGPKKHPGNDVYQSFENFVSSGCAQAQGCPEHWLGGKEEE
jgi:hypothetical protein